MKIFCCLIFSLLLLIYNSPQDVFAEDLLKPINIGVISPITGSFPILGAGAAKTIKLACDEWNAKKKLPSVRCIVEDDGFDSKKGVSAYKKLKEMHHIDALINVSSTTIAAITPLVRADGIPVAQAFMEGSQAEKDNIVQICPAAEIAEEALGRELAKRYSGKIVVVASIADAVTILADGLRKGIGRPIVQIDIPIESTDVKPYVLRIIREKPAAIMFITVPTHGALIEKELRALKSNIPRVFDANFISAISEFEKTLGDLSPLKDSLLLNIGIPESRELTEYRKKYKERYKEDPAPWSEFSYDSFQVLMSAYSPNRATWISQLQKASLQGLSGKIEFTETGTTKPVYEFTTVGEVLEKKK